MELKEAVKLEEKISVLDICIDLFKKVSLEIDHLEMIRNQCIQELKKYENDS